jgi:hypothetical protein
MVALVDEAGKLVATRRIGTPHLSRVEQALHEAKQRPLRVEAAYSVQLRAAAAASR